MKGSQTDRAIRLLSSLARHPRHIFPYLRRLPLWGKQPVDIELPWFSFGAIEFLENHLRAEHNVFEFGSGGSSFFLARRVAHVLCVENDRIWQRRISDLAVQRKISNLQCELHPIEAAHPEYYGELSYFNALRPLPYDIIIVDGACDYENAQYGILRQLAFDRALVCIRRPGGIIVVDDYWMFPEMASRAPEAKLFVFESAGPCRYGVTSTAVFKF